MKDIIANSMITAAIAILLILCLYAYIWQPHGQTMYLRGRNDTINSVLVQLQQKQEITIITPNGEVVLVPKANEKVSD